jgi:hypothetical protein
VVLNPAQEGFLQVATVEEYAKESSNVAARYFDMTDTQYRELWVESPDGQSLCALINGDRGWLMYLREMGDAGFSSRNPDYAGPADAMIEYRLANGDTDEYPASWSLPIDAVERALEYFRTEHKPPPFIHWYNDSEDGVTLEYRNT